MRLAHRLRLAAASVLFGIVITIAQGCGSGGTAGFADGGAAEGGDGGGSGEAGDGGRGAGPIACGSTTCEGTTLCLQPCCGGVASLCTAKPDGGDCPAGTHEAQCQPSGGGSFGTNCEQDPCTPPPPSCVDSASDPNATGCTPDENDPRRLVCVCA